MNAKYTKNAKYASLLASFAAVSTVTMLAASEQAANSKDAPTEKATPPASTTAAKPAVAAKATTVAKAAPLSAVKANPNGAAISYRSPAFDRFVVDSYHEAGLSDAQAKNWYAWMDGAYRKSGVRYAGKANITSLAPLMDSIGKDYANAKPAQKTQIELKTGAFVHKMIKTSIPKFSLDRGFEFAQAMQRGERQCYLQAIMVSGLMQRAHMNAGVVMVSKSDKGEATNNGHCVALVKLTDGRDVLVDVSHSDPFVAQQGLMVADAQTGAYRYVAPSYDAHETITGYHTPSGGASVPLSQVRGLDSAYLTSQFDYYRGERAPGGFVASQKTPAGLTASARYLEKSIKECPQNPLAQYVLGRVYLRQGKTADAKTQIETAYHIYDKAGWVPDGEKEALALVKSAPQTLSMR